MRIAALLVAAALIVGCSSDPDPDATTATPGDTGQTPAATERRSPAGPIQPPPAPDDPELAAIRGAYQQEPTDPRQAGRLAVALFERGRTEEAVVLFEQLARDQPTVGAFLNLARAYTMLSRFPEAEATYRQVLAARPEQPVALHSLGNIALRRGETEEAIDLYARAVAARPDYILGQLHLGDALTEAGLLEEAYESYSAVMRLEPRTPPELEAFDDALYKMARLDIRMGKLDRGAKLLGELLAGNPEHPSGHYAYGQVLMQLGREQEAEQSFARHLALMAAQKPTGGMAMGQ